MGDIIDDLPVPDSLRADVIGKVDGSSQPPKLNKAKVEKGSGPSQATVIADIVMAEKVQFFHAGDEGYASFRKGNHGALETAAIRSKAFRRYCARLYYRQHKRAPGSQAIQDALATLEGIALYDAPEGAINVRIAERNGSLFLDLADETRQIVEISSDGWRVIPSADCPVRFRRPKALQALPIPKRGGSWDNLRDLLNADADGFVLVVAFILATFRPGVPMPVLLFNSEQGSGKSTGCRIVRGLCDPNAAPLRSEPREPRDLMIAASNGHIIALDNISHVSPWLSDALCRLSTGGGFSTRTLYENDEETIFDALRPVMLNGIEEVATRSDLLERSIRVSLPTIPEEKRMPESKLWRAFDKAAPGILGVLLDAVSTALANIESVKLNRLPRMADFARWIVAAEGALPWESGAFMRVYAGNREAAHELAVELNPVGPVLIDFARANAVDGWAGTATELHEILSERAGDAARRKGWPGRANVLSGILSRLAPNFRHLGIIIERDREGTSRQRLIRIRTVTQETVPIVRDRPQCDSEAENADCADDGRTQADDGRTVKMPVRAHADDADDDSRTHSEGGVRCTL